MGSTYESFQEFLNYVYCLKGLSIFNLGSISVCVYSSFRLRPAIEYQCCIFLLISLENWEFTFLNVIALPEQGLEQASKATPLKVQKTVVTKPPTPVPCMLSPYYYFIYCCQGLVWTLKRIETVSSFNQQYLEHKPIPHKG